MPKQVINFNPALCKKCGLCSYTCPRGVIAGKIGELPQVIELDRCTNCLLCFYRCPDFALEVGGNRS